MCDTKNDMKIETLTYMRIVQKTDLGRGNNMCEGLEMRSRFVCLRNFKKMPQKAESFLLKEKLV